MSKSSRTTFKISYDFLFLSEGLILDTLALLDSVFFVCLERHFFLDDVFRLIVASETLHVLLDSMTD